MDIKTLPLRDDHAQIKGERRGGGQRCIPTGMEVAGKTGWGWIHGSVAAHNHLLQGCEQAALRIGKADICIARRYRHVRDSSRRGSRRKHPEPRTAGSGQQGTGDTAPEVQTCILSGKNRKDALQTDSHDAQHITVDGQLPCRIRHGVPSQPINP